VRREVIRLLYTESDTGSNPASGANLKIKQAIPCLKVRLAQAKYKYTINNRGGLTMKIVDDIKKFKALIETAETRVDEAAQVEIIGYNSGTGLTLQKAMNDPKYRRKVNVVSMEMDPHTQAPVLKFRELNGDGPFTAEWDSKVGWHADFD